MNRKTLVGLILIALVASLSPAHAQTFSIIHSFLNGWEGTIPYAGVTLRNGTLYGTTAYGGSNDCGTVYQIKQSGSDWVFTPIYIFQGGQNPYDGCVPNGRVVFGADGNLYGTTVAGNTNRGLVFELIPPVSAICKTAACLWTQNVLHMFAGSPNDGANPRYGDIVWDEQGNVYDMTSAGGSAMVGTVFQMTKTGSNWTETPIYNFHLPNDAYPENSVIVDSNGNLFGVSNGSVFEMSYIPGIGWQEIIIHSMNPNYDGNNIYAGLIRDSSGNLYGAASTAGPDGGGTVFELSPSGNTYTFKIIHSFSGGYLSGPSASLSMDAQGNLYGTTYYGGAFGAGNVFKLTKAGDSWEYTSLHDFRDWTQGSNPWSQVTIGPDGTLYGTTNRGGPGDWGTVWMIKP
ncbi:MAG: choice-of-anchor tandem repeat GloVer-containing protein [Candidatus Korobacteraceae bacterium]